MTKKPNSSDDHIHFYIAGELSNGDHIIVVREDGMTDEEYARDQRFVDLFESARGAGSDEIVIHHVSAPDDEPSFRELQAEADDKVHVYVAKGVSRRRRIATRLEDDTDEHYANKQEILDIVTGYNSDYDDSIARHSVSSPDDINSEEDEPAFGVML